MLSGVIIGSGIFISPSLVLREVHDVGVSLSVWVLSGILTLLGALSYCELATTVQTAGGSYAYVLYVYGSMPAFLISWTQSLLIDPTTLAAITLSLGNYAIKPFENVIEVQPWHAKVIAVCCILVIFVTNCISTKITTSLQTIFNCAQISAIIFIVLLGLWQLCGGKIYNFENMFGNAVFNTRQLGSYGTAFFGSLWAYNGWNTIGNITEDMIHVEKNVFRTVISAVPFVLFSYVIVNLSFLTVLSPEEIAESSTVAIDFVQKVLEKDVAYVVPVLVAISCYGSANGMLFAASRVPMSAGREGHMPSLLGTIHRDRRTPIPALMMTTVIALFLLLPNANDLESLIDLASVAYLFVYGITILGVIVLRVKCPLLYRPFKVWIGIPVLMVVVFGLLALLAFFQRPVNSSCAVGFILAGVPVYYLLAWPGRQPFQFGLIKRFTVFAKKKLNLVPCTPVV